MKQRKLKVVPDIHDTALNRSAGANTARELSKIYPGIPIAAMAALGCDRCTIMPFGEWAAENQGRLYVQLHEETPFEVYESGRQVKFQGTELPNDDREFLSVRMSDVNMLLSKDLCEKIDTEEKCPKEVIDLLIKGLKDGSITVWTEEVGS